MAQSSFRLLLFFAVSFSWILTQTSFAYKILMIPVPAHSHIWSFVAIAEDLTSRGQQLTILVPEHFPFRAEHLQNGSTVAIERYTDSDGGATVDYDEIYEDLIGTAYATKTVGSISVMLRFWNVHCVRFCEFLTMKNDEVLDRLSENHFDLGVIDGFAYMYCHTLVVHRLGIPFVSFEMDIGDPNDTRAPWPPSFVPSFVFEFGDRMTFMERLVNAVSVPLWRLLIRLSAPDNILDKYRQYGQFDSMKDLKRKALINFLLLDSIFTFPRPLMPNIVEVGGLLLKKTHRELQGDIKRFVGGAERGVVLMSFGTLTSRMPPETVRKFMSAFRRLDGYRVVWRLNNKDNVELPDNVMIRPWLPQNDILADPRSKLFIAHCGLNGIFEALYHGVPVICFPLLGDQLRNAANIHHRGYGIRMHIHEFSPEELLENMNKILANEAYTERLSKTSAIMRSRPETPVERASYWIEHVCKFGGDHLRSAGDDLPLYSYLMLDILGVVLLVVVLAFVLLISCCRFVGRKCSKLFTKDAWIKLKAN